MMSASERLRVLLDLRQVAAKLFSLPGRFGIQSETYYWTTVYHLNIRLYEKLLFGIFDILDEGQLIAVYVIFHIQPRTILHFCQLYCLMLSSIFSFF